VEERSSTRLNTAIYRSRLSNEKPPPWDFKSSRLQQLKREFLERLVA
jgi:hypothetical protein